MSLGKTLHLLLNTGSRQELSQCDCKTVDWDGLFLLKYLQRYVAIVK